MYLYTLRITLVRKLYDKLLYFIIIMVHAQYYSSIG